MLHKHKKQLEGTCYEREPNGIAQVGQHRKRYENECQNEGEKCLWIPALGAATGSGLIGHACLI